MFSLLIQTMEWITILQYPIYFIPKFREGIRYKLASYYITLGIVMMAVIISMILFVLPNLNNLYQSAKLGNAMQFIFIISGIQFVISGAILLMGFRLKRFTSKSNKNFYIMHTILTVFFLIWLQLFFYSVINPIVTIVDTIR